jgi:hypothetical protein
MALMMLNDAFPKESSKKKFFNPWTHDNTKSNDGPKGFMLHGRMEPNNGVLSRPLKNHPIEEKNSEEATCGDAQTYGDLLPPNLFDFFHGHRVRGP